MSYTVKNISEKTGISAHTLRYYEKEGLLTDISRTKGGIRYYTDRDLEVLDLICCLKNTGMPLKEIKSFVQLSKHGNSTLKERCSILKDHQKNMISQIEEMKLYLEKVTWKLNYFTNLLNQYGKNENEL